MRAYKTTYIFCAYFECKKTYIVRILKTSKLCYVIGLKYQSSIVVIVVFITDCEVHFRRNAGNFNNNMSISSKRLASDID